MSIGLNISGLRSCIAASCAKAGRGPASVTIVAVTKGRTVEQIREVVAAGITDIGENRIQEALLKYNALREPITDNRKPIKWHMVGHLQTNKVKDAVRIFDLIHSVDSIHLAEEIDKQAAKVNKVQDVLLEIKTSPEATKYGMRLEELPGAMEVIGRLKNISVKGLMTIAPLVDNREKSRPYFRQLRELRDDLLNMRLVTCDLRHLSMGMTGDFQVAIEEGATMVRIGRAIFGS